MAELRRLCRACAQNSPTTDPHCPHCGASYGPVEFGLDRQPGALAEWNPLPSKAPAQEPGQMAAFSDTQVVTGRR